MSVAPFDVRLDMDDRTMVEPDIMIVCDPDIDGAANHLDGQPDLAIEILSPSTRETDCTVKLRKYMNAGVREYWIINPEGREVMVYHFESQRMTGSYSFDDTVPVELFEGKVSIDFSRIAKQLDSLFG